MRETRKSPGAIDGHMTNWARNWSINKTVAVGYEEGMRMSIVSQPTIAPAARKRRTRTKTDAPTLRSAS